MLRVNNISKSFGGQKLFDDLCFTMSKGEKVGMVGRNGSGKSTLFRIILGEMDADSGEVAIPKTYRIGTLPQHIKFTQSTVLAEGCLALSEEEQYSAYKVEKILSGLGFSNDDMEKDPNNFSGGFQIRINLAKALVQKPDLLLLDEPTNYLDIISQRWLRDYIRSYPGEIILITHDRDFMDGACTHVMGLHRKKLRKLTGDTLNYYTKLAEEEENYEKTRKNQEQAKKHLEKYINRFRASARRSTQAQSKAKQLAKFDDMQALSREHNLAFAFSSVPCPGKTLMSVKNLTFGYEEGHKLIKQLSFSIARDDRLGIIGKNGKGKSTLLNLLAGELKPQSGTVKLHPSAEIGHFGQTNIARLNEHLTIVDEVASANVALNNEQARKICGVMMFPQDLALKKISILSGGERSRVLLGKILAKPANLLLLDEPTNHLDQESIEGMIEGLNEYDGAVALVTHSEMILRRTVNKIIVFHENYVDFIDGGYDYFLDKYGWDYQGKIDEPVHEAEVKSPQKTILTKKALRQQKSQVITERSKQLGPLKQKIEKLEKEICELEKSLTESNVALLEASASQAVEQFVQLSKSVKEFQQQIEVKFKQLEKVSLQYDEEEKKFAVQLSDFEPSSAE